MRGGVICFQRLSHLFFWVLIIISNSPVYAKDSIPAGFEALSFGQDELLNISFHGENEGVFTVFVTPEYLTFKEPNKLFAKLPLDGVPENIRKKILFELAMPISRHDKDFYFAPEENIGIIYNEQEQSAMLLITPRWVKNNSQHFFHQSYNARSALVSHQSLVFSHDGHMESLGGTGYFAQGVGRSNYIQGDWVLFQNVGERGSSSQFQFNNLYLRTDITPRIYSQVGRMDLTNLSSRLGGDFSLSLLPQSQIDGLRIGSSNAYLNTENITTTATPLTVILTQPARVDIYQGRQLIGSSYLMAGIHDVDTNNFPAGAYPVLLKIFQNGKLIRQETQFFENSDRNQPAAGEIQWFFQVGKQHASNDYSAASKLTKKNKEETQFAGGIRFGLSSHLSLTSALMGRKTGSPFSESDLTWTLPTRAGILSLKYSYLMKEGKGISDSEQLGWDYSNMALNISRYHTFCTNQISCHNNYGVIASTSKYGWTASLGYNYSYSAQRFLQPLEYERDESSYINPSIHQQNSGLSLYSSQYVTSSILLTLGTSTNYQDWSIWPRIGMFSNRSSGSDNHDNGIFLTVSLSKNMQSSSNFNHNTTASLDYRQHSQNNNISLRQQWVWSGQHYRSLDATLSGGRYYQNALVNTELGSSLGNAGISFSYDRSKQYTNKTISGHYDSTFTISSAGFVLGNGDGNESSLSGVIIDSKNQNQKELIGPIAKITSMQGGDAYISYGSKLFIPTMDYMADKINIEDAIGYETNGNLINGAGTQNIFLLPGHVTISRLRANTIYIYVGRLLVNGENILAGGHILNADVPDIN
ncbi:TcfC E-set like domain-containing protein, partial [Edwardsiella tarda]